MQALKIKIYNDPQEAPNYNDLMAKGETIKAASLTDCYVVRNGTEGGNATIDLIFTDENGNKHVAMITAHLLKMPLIAAGVIHPSDVIDQK